MWRGIFVTSGLWMLLLQQSSRAQDAADQQTKPLRLQTYLQLHVSSGRIEVEQRDVGQSRTVSAGHPELGYRQHLQLQVRPPCVVVQYEAIDPEGQLTLRLCERHKLVIERISGNPDRLASVRYEQPQSGPVKLTVTGQSSHEFTAPSLWHLFLGQPQICREHLTPMLALVRPDWQLVEQAAQAREALLASAPEADVTSQERTWKKLVDELGSVNFSRRQVADTSLRDGGRSAAAFLARLDGRPLSAEQRLRIERICRSFADGTTDTPKRVAATLLGDRRVWLCLLADPQVDARTIAAEHLSRMLGRQIAFDPHADEKTRQSQVAELARRIGVQ